VYGIIRRLFGQIHGLKIVSPNSTNISATHFGASDEYANMINSKSYERRYDHYINMLLKALIVRSTTQKDEKPFRTRKGINLKPARPGDVSLSLDGTDKLIALTIEGT
jgi:hypothetical protein